MKFLEELCRSAWDDKKVWSFGRRLMCGISPTSIDRLLDPHQFHVGATLFHINRTSIPTSIARQFLLIFLILPLYVFAPSNFLFLFFFFVVFFFSSSLLPKPMKHAHLSLYEDEGVRTACVCSDKQGKKTKKEENKKERMKKSVKRNR